MKRHATQLSLILAAFAFAPTALAGSEIVKCVDQSGHVTLTDQPCSGNAATVRLVQATGADEARATEDAAPEAELTAAPQVAQVAAVERHTARALVRQANWKTSPAPRSRPLARDVATLKAARMQMLMLDSAKRQPTLAIR